MSGGTRNHFYQGFDEWASRLQLKTITFFLRTNAVLLFQVLFLYFASGFLLSCIRLLVKEKRDVVFLEYSLSLIVFL